MLFTETITVYNHYDGTWHKTVLPGVMVVRSIEKVVDSNGVLKHVPVVNVTVPHRKGYVHPKEYRGQGFTFGIDNLDIITLGKCDTEITADYTITALKKDRPDTWTIRAVSDNTARDYLKHWQITCEA